MELLLQSDNDGLEWHKALTEAIHTYVRLLYLHLHYIFTLIVLNPCTDINVFRVADVGV